MRARSDDGAESCEESLSTGPQNGQRTIGLRMDIYIYGKHLYTQLFPLLIQLALSFYSLPVKAALCSNALNTGIKERQDQRAPQAAVWKGFVQKPRVRSHRGCWSKYYSWFVCLSSQKQEQMFVLFFLDLAKLSLLFRSIFWFSLRLNESLDLWHYWLANVKPKLL